MENPFSRVSRIRHQSPCRGIVVMQSVCGPSGSSLVLYMFVSSVDLLFQCTKAFVGLGTDTLNSNAKSLHILHCGLLAHGKNPQVWPYDSGHFCNKYCMLAAG